MDGCVVPKPPIELMSDSEEFKMVEAKDRYYFPLLILVVFDFLVFSLSFMAAYSFRFFTVMFEWFPPPKPPYIPEWMPYMILSAGIGILGIAVYERFGIYDRRVGLDRQVRPGSLILATLVSYIFIMAILFNYRGISYSRLTIALAVPFSCFAVILAHALLKQTQFLMIQKGIVFYKTVLIGPEWRCLEVVKKLQEHHGSQYQILGYVNTDESRKSGNALLPQLATVPQLPALFQSHTIDHAIIAMPPKDHREILPIIHQCATHKIPYQVIPDLFDLLSQRVRVEEIDAIPPIMFGETPLYGAGQAIKRIMDMIVSSTALVLTSPLIFLLAVLIKLDTRGSVFYVQERVGNDGRKFNIFKFRSMIDQAEKDTGPMWATNNDPRTTRIGRFLRRYNLDELPQFLNVLRGEMSLVGPRPERPFFVNKFKEEIPLYMRRHMVKTGITGWAQVNGLRGDTSVEERTEYDLYYVRNWSILFDLKIIWKTFTSFKNAY